MTNFQLKYELSLVFDKIILCFLSAVFLVVFDKIMLVSIQIIGVRVLEIILLSAKIIHNKVRLGQKVLKFEFAVEAIIIFVKNIKKTLSGMFTLLISQLYELRKIYPNIHPSPSKPTYL